MRPTARPLNIFTGSSRELLDGTLYLVLESEENHES